MIAENQIRGQLQLAPAGDVPDNNQVMPTVGVFMVQDGVVTDLTTVIEDLIGRVETLETP